MFLLACAPDLGDGASEAEGSESESETGGDEVPRFDGEPEVIRYERQPMVVDIRVPVVGDASAPELDITHLGDDGVRHSVEPGQQPGVLRARLRGLRPGEEHDVELGLGDETKTLVFETHPALVGYVSGFEVSTDGDFESDVFRIFDTTNIPMASITRMFAVDGEGVTRFFLGDETMLTGPPSIRAGVKLREDGTLLYLFSDAIRIVDELGDEQFKVTAQALGVAGLHHDVIELENGHFLALSYTFRDIDYPSDGLMHVAGDMLVEVDPAGELVWQWDSFDHLDPLRVRDGFELTIPDPENGGELGQDWTHGNGVIERDGVYLLSLRHQDWMVAIDRADGEVQWRLGDEGDFTLQEGTWFFHPHSPQWQGDGRLLLYDNGVGNPDLPDGEETSRAVIYEVDEDAMSARQAWQDDGEPFVAPVAGDADRLPGGNLLVLDSSIAALPNFRSRLRELDPDGDPMQVWSIESKFGTFIYRAIAATRLVGEASE